MHGPVARDPPREGGGGVGGVGEGLGGSVAVKEEESTGGLGGGWGRSRLESTHVTRAADQSAATREKKVPAAKTQTHLR